MQVALTRGELLAIRQRFGVLGDIRGLRFAYAAKRIKDKLDAIERETQNITAVSKEYEAFDAERNSVAASYADKDGLGNPVIINNNGVQEYQMTDENRNGFDAAFEELKKKHPGVFEERAAKKAALDVFLAQVEGSEFYEIKKETIPDSITVAQYDLISPFVVDEAE